jgi:hypothetical protein
LRSSSFWMGESFRTTRKVPALRLRLKNETSHAHDRSLRLRRNRNKEMNYEQSDDLGNGRNR